MTPIACAEPVDAGSWQWRHSSQRSTQAAAPSRRAKGPPPAARVKAVEQSKRQARAEVYRAQAKQRSTGLKLAPHLIALIGDDGPRVVRAAKIGRVDQWKTAAERVQLLVMRERGAFAALVLPMVLLAAALLIDVATGVRVKDGVIGQSIATLDRRMLEPSPLVRAHVLARARTTEAHIVAALPEFPLVTAMPSMSVPAQLARAETPQSPLAVVVPEVVIVTELPVEREHLALPKLALLPEVPNGSAAEPVLTPPDVVVPREVAVVAPQPSVVADPMLEQSTSTGVNVAQCQRSDVVSSADAARLAVSQVLSTSEPGDPLTFGRTLAAAAMSQVKELSIYNAKYVTLSYPKGDVSTQFGVCSDVIIRAYRALSIDLQELVYLSRAGPADSNIDHRRTELLRAFFALHGESLSTSPYAEDYLPGDIVTYYRPQNKSSTAHIAIVTDEIAPSGRPMIVHNRGWGVQLEDALFVDQMTGHYRFRGLAAEAMAALPRSSRMANAAHRLNGRLAVLKAQKSPIPVATANGVAAVVSPQQPNGRSARPAEIATGVATVGATGLPAPMGLGFKPAAASLR